MKFKYFVYKVNSDQGPHYFKTSAKTLDAAITNIMLFEGCPKVAITIYSIPLNLFHWNTKSLFNQKDKNPLNQVF